MKSQEIQQTFCSV